MKHVEGYGEREKDRGGEMNNEWGLPGCIKKRERGLECVLSVDPGRV